MTTLEELKSQISQAKESLEQTRQRAKEQETLIEQRRQESLQAEGKIQEQEKKLPFISQKRLRQGIFAGLEGRKRRQIVSKARKELKAQQKGISLFKGSLTTSQEELSKYESDVLKPFETQIISKEAEVKAYATKVSALDRARDIYLSTSPYAVFALQYESDLVKKYYKQLAETNYSIIRGTIQEATGLSVPAFQSLSPEEISKFPAETIKQLRGVGAIRDLSRTEIVKDIAPLTQAPKTSFSLFGGFPLVSASQVEINPATGRPYGTIEKAQQPSGILERWSSSLKRGFESQPSKETSFSPKSFLLGAGVSLVGTAIAGKELLFHPVQTSKSIGLGIWEGGKKFFRGELAFPQVSRTLQKSPSFGLGFVSAELVTAKGIGEGVKATSKIVSREATLISPKFKPVSIIDDTRIIKDIPTTKSSGKTAQIVGLESEFRVSIPKKIDIPLAERIPTLSLSAQVGLAGQSRTLVSGARDLFGFFRKDIPIKKTLFNEELLSPSTKALLKQFDEGKLPQSRIAELNRRIQQEGGGKGLLERTFFADPKGRLRPSRLGIRKEERASVLDILSGDVRIGKAKPQAIILPDTKISKFPSFLEDVRKTLSEGKALTESQKARLLEWQLKPTGEFKPMGFLTREAEVTATGGILKKVETSAVTIIDGVRVPIIEAKIVKPSIQTETLLGKLSSNKITAKEIKTLSNRLKKETGIDYSSALTSQKYVSPSTFVGSGLSASKFLSSSKTTSPISSVSSAPPSVSSGVSTITSIGSGVPSGVSTITSIGSGVPSGVSTITSIGSGSATTGSSYFGGISIPPPSLDYKKYDSKVLDSRGYGKQGEEIGYDVGVVKKGKPKIIKKGLNLEDARDYGAERALKTLRATFFLKKSQQKAKDISDTNIFKRNRILFRKPSLTSELRNKLKGAEEIWVQKRRKVLGRGSRLGHPSEVGEINLFRKDLNLGFGTSRKKKKRNKRFDWFI